jgi:hypothetical protein
MCLSYFPRLAENVSRCGGSVSTERLSSERCVKVHGMWNEETEQPESRIFGCVCGMRFEGGGEHRARVGVE